MGRGGANEARLFQLEGLSARSRQFDEVVQHGVRRSESIDGVEVERAARLCGSGHGLLVVCEKQKTVWKMRKRTKRDYRMLDRCDAIERVSELSVSMKV